MKINMLEPKDTTKQKLELNLSERTVKLLQLYAEFLNYSQDDIVEHYLEEAYKVHQRFHNWGYSRRNNKLFKKYMDDILQLDPLGSNISEMTSNTDNEEEVASEAAE